MSEHNINKKLGLPFGKMQKVAICFDVDGTLINEESENTKTVDLLFSFLYQGWKNLDVIIWSGGGAKYAESQLRRLLPEMADKLKYYSKLQYDEIREKYDLIIAIDDIQDTALGDVNLIVRNK